MQRRIISFDPVNVTSTDVTPADLVPTGLNEQEVNDTLTLIKEVIQYDSSYIIIDKTKIEAAILAPTTEAINFFTIQELNHLLNQSVYLGFISNLDAGLLVARDDYNLFNTYISLDNYKRLLSYQLSYDPVIKRYTPEISELQDKGLDTYTIDLIKSNFISIIENSNNIGIIKNEVDIYLDNKYRSESFTPNTKIDYIYKFPTDLLRILTNQELVDILNRTKGYLDFLTPSLISTLIILPTSTTSTDLTNLISVNEIKAIVDKEIDLKNSVVNALGYNELQSLFNSIKENFISTDLSGIILDTININSILTLTQAQTIIKDALLFAEANTGTDVLLIQ